MNLYTCVCFVSVKRDADTNNEEQLKVKEQAILELGSLLADTKQAEGNKRLYFSPLSLTMLLQFNTVPS